jgi:hypothetical protein
VRHGWIGPAELSAATVIDRSAVYWLLQKLTELGYVGRREEGGAEGALGRGWDSAVRTVNSADAVIESADPKS